MKEKKIFFCTECGTEFPKWQGQCGACNAWNTLKEEVIRKETPAERKKKSWTKGKKIKPGVQRVQDISPARNVRIITRDTELNRTLGGGIVPGSIILIGGEPGIGKSTLLLQMALVNDLSILYVSGEESEEQLRMRADRIGISNQACYILTETNLQKIFDEIQKIGPQLVIIVGHITKDGQIAGPKLLEHVVDTVLLFEGDRNHNVRILRTTKNRFGSTNEMGIYEMRDTGLREVSNPSELLLSQSDENFPGSAVAATMEGVRPMLIETQALVSKAVYGTPQRSSTGFDLRRLSMLLAVLEKRAGLFFGQNDVFLNLAGGIRVVDPALDLAIVAALVSSLENISISRSTCFAGEVGLTGEIRAVNRIDQRIREAERLGFEKIYISKYNQKAFDPQRFNIEIISLKSIDDLVNTLLI